MFLGHGPQKVPERPDHRHTRGVGAGLAECDGDLVVALLQLHASDNGFAVHGTQRFQNRFIPFERFSSDRPLERRRPLVGLISDFLVYRSELHRVPR